MSRNVEIKAAAKRWAAQRRAAGRLAARPPEVLRQHDTFFRVAHGRLKLREFTGRRGRSTPAELISYRRPDRRGPKTSQYSMARVGDPVGLKACLGEALGVLGVVRKTRWLYLVGQTRVHFDKVEGLGRFVELEVVLKRGQSVAAGRRIAAALMEALDIRREDLLSCAYLDLLVARGQVGG